ncbi:alcohol dehydrogenase GroES domain protein [Dendrothele bispora CBS 962.96]|uniref:Alcohol dehydrogenase GroES domain protein n=1 Tax=Dendrothele bispora (strain CBS 962.96) TaxID=1314807 RepID=A0A4S8L9L5_DENBC|nr:alcohol dehydrogenase GroES domain protein [Dendrothele bispora CBS 962.96]
MRAVKYYGPGEMRVEEVPEPSANDTQIKIKIAWCGICGTDVHCYMHQIPFTPSTVEPNKVTGETLPIIFGHEMSGTISELGPLVDKTRFSVGQKVVVEPTIGCMKPTCAACQAGTLNICPMTGSIGLCGFGGGLAEYITVQQHCVHVLPPNVPLDVGACIEPLAVAWYAVKRSEFTPGQTVLICGGGPIGLFILKCIKSIDPTSQVFLTEPSQIRRETASKHGATILNDYSAPLSTTAPTFSSPSSDTQTSLSYLSSQILSYTNKIGVDLAFDAAGVSSSINLALQSLKTRGKLVAVATWGKMAEVDLNLVLKKELWIGGIYAYTGVHPELIQAVADGRFKGLDELITKRIKLEDVVEKGIKVLSVDKSESKYQCSKCNNL